MFGTSFPGNQSESFIFLFEMLMEASRSSSSLLFETFIINSFCGDCVFVLFLR